ncbi:MAG TPA: cell division topological specificity factor MinE [Candidatus Limnocylindrales bacterium]|nr:cell division topological specificity factor MinE [Candidatus Limnocylindrales bacterium]
MSNFFDRLFGKPNKSGSSSKAKERLQFILVHDRINLPPERLEEMKAEILKVISKYVSVDSDHVDIALQKRERSPYLVAEIPFQKMVERPDDDGPDVPPRPAPASDDKKPQ